MRIFGIFFVLFLLGIWTRMSWFYYTCVHKGFCEMPASLEQNEKWEEDVAEKSIIQSENLVDRNNTVTQNEVLSEENTEKWEENEESITQTGNTLLSEENLSEIQEISDLCENPIEFWISLWGRNESEDVLKLEKFLNEYEGESLAENGKYESADEAAVKRFQEKYRSSILTPAWIRNPTGVVYTGTIRVITGIACGKEYPVSQSYLDAQIEEDETQEEEETSSEQTQNSLNNEEAIPESETSENTDNLEIPEENSVTM